MKSAAAANDFPPSLLSNNRLIDRWISKKIARNSPIMDIVIFFVIDA